VAPSRDVELVGTVVLVVAPEEHAVTSSITAIIVKSRAIIRVFILSPVEIRSLCLYSHMGYRDDIMDESCIIVKIKTRCSPNI
jgi:hypothetical protein